MKKISEMHVNEIKQRIAVLTAIKNSLEFTGRVLPDDDKIKLDAYKTELDKRPK